MRRAWLAIAALLCCLAEPAQASSPHITWMQRPSGERFLRPGDSVALLPSGWTLSPLCTLGFVQPDPEAAQVAQDLVQQRLGWRAPEDAVDWHPVSQRLPTPIRIPAPDFFSNPHWLNPPDLVQSESDPRLGGTSDAVAEVLGATVVIAVIGDLARIEERARSHVVSLELMACRRGVGRAVAWDAQSRLGTDKRLRRDLRDHMEALMVHLLDDDLPTWSRAALPMPSSPCTRDALTLLAERDPGAAGIVLERRLAERRRCDSSVVSATRALVAAALGDMDTARGHGNTVRAHGQRWAIEFDNALRRVTDDFAALHRYRWGGG